MNYRIIGIIILVLSFINTAGAQELPERSENFWGAGFSYGVDFPAGDLADRFGRSFHAGVSVDFFRKKMNAVISLEALIFFGSNVEEDVLAGQRTESGAILGNNGSYADVFLRQRGLFAGLLFNKNIVPLKENRHAGLSAGLGLGVLQHNIRLQVDSRNAPQLSGDYAKGYDRHTMGPALKQNLSYLHIGKNKTINYEIRLFVIEAFTKNTRIINFDTGLKDDASRLDIIIGMEFKWLIPLKDQQAAGEIFY